jgi:hypothetical protein
MTDLYDQYTPDPTLAQTQGSGPSVNQAADNAATFINTPTPSKLTPEADANYQSQDLVQNRQAVLDAAKKQQEGGGGNKALKSVGDSLSTASANSGKEISSSGTSAFDTIFHSSPVSPVQSLVETLKQSANTQQMSPIDFYKQASQVSQVQTPNMMQYSDKNLKTNIKSANKDIKDFLNSLYGKI